MKHRQVGISRIGVINSDGHTIGIDIGATGVRAAILTQGSMDGRPSVTTQGIGRVDLPPGAVVAGIVVEPAVVTEALKALWAEHRFECRNVIVGIANEQVLVRDLTIPNLDPQRRAKALPFQAKEVVALPIDEVILDFCQLGAPDPETDKLRGLLIATPREPVLTAVTAVEKANLRVARVDLSAFGTLRAIGGEAPAVEAIIDMGAHLTTIVVHDHGVPKMVRTLPRGGEHITDLLADRLSITPLEAEQTKRTDGLESSNNEVARAVVEALRPLIAEIRTSIGYFRSTNGNAQIERISLTGGGANLRGVAPVFAEQLGLPTRVVDPMQHVRNRTSKQVRTAEPTQAPSAASIGLAMGAAA